MNFSNNTSISVQHEHLTTQLNLNLKSITIYVHYKYSKTLSKTRNELVFRFETVRVETPETI